MAAIVKRVAAVLASIVWLCLILVLLAAFLAPGLREILPTQVRDFTDREALLERLDDLAVSLPGGVRDLFLSEPSSLETPTPESAVMTPHTATSVPDNPTEAPPATPTATTTPVPTMGSAEERKPPASEQLAAIPVAVVGQADLRSDPNEDADVIGQVATGGTVTVIGIDATGAWYRLGDDTWIAAVDLVDAPQGQLPIETVEYQPTTVPVQQTPISETTVPATETQLASVQAVVNADANLRSGPGTEYERLDGAFFGDEVSVVGKSADEEWYLLANGAWLFATLVVEAVDVPIVAEEMVPELPQTSETETETTEVDPSDTEVDPSDTEVDPTDTEVDPTDTEVDPTDTEVDPSDTEVEPTDTEVEPTDTEVDPTDTEVDPTDTEVEPTDTEVEPTDTEVEPTDTEVEPTDTVVSAPLGANLRSGPGVTFARVDGVEQGEVLVIVAQDPSSAWLKVEEGSWIFATLVDNVPADLPVESGEVIVTESDDTGEDGQEEQTDESNLEVQTGEDETGEQTDEGESDVPADEGGQVVFATLNVDANFRSGPSLEETIVGSALAGTQITIVGQSDDGLWFQLDNGYWISAELVNIAPQELGVNAAFGGDAESTGA